MARIGTWKKSVSIRGDLILYLDKNDNRIAIMKSAGNKWMVETSRFERPHGFKYLTEKGTTTFSKTRAIELARAYMLLHPGIKKLKKKRQKGRK